MKWRGVEFNSAILFLLKKQDCSINHRFSSRHKTFSLLTYLSHFFKLVPPVEMIINLIYVITDGTGTRAPALITFTSLLNKSVIK